MRTALALVARDFTLSRRHGCLGPERPSTGPAPAAAAAPAKCDNPNALGVARVVEIDTTGGPGFGFEHFKAYDFLRTRKSC